MAVVVFICFFISRQIVESVFGIQSHQLTNNDQLVVICVISSFQDVFWFIDLSRMVVIISGILQLPFLTPCSSLHSRKIANSVYYEYKRKIPHAA